jgi:hypothetical protein
MKSIGRIVLKGGEDYGQLTGTREQDHSMEPNAKSILSLLAAGAGVCWLFNRPDQDKKVAIQWVAFVGAPAQSPKIVPVFSFPGR